MPKTLGAIVGLAIAVTVVVGLLPLVLPYSRVPENWLSDFRQASFATAAPDKGDIVVVTITEETLANFPYRSPLDRAFLADLLADLKDAGARAVGVDILFDQATEAEKDQALYRLLRDYPVPLVAVSAAGESGLTQAQVDYVHQFLHGVKTGHAGLTIDQADGTVRWFVPGKQPAFTTVLAETLGLAMPSTPRRIDYLGPGSGRPYAFPAYAAQALKFLPKDWFRDKVVLVGADLPMTDRHRTPFAALEGAGRGARPGVMIHAQILAQVMDGRVLNIPGPAGNLALLFAVALLGAGFAFVDCSLVLRAAGLAGFLVLLWGGAFAVHSSGGPLLPLIMPSVAFILSAGTASAYAGRRDRQAAAYIRNAFSRYLSPHIVDQLADDPAALKLGGERREVTYLFTDLASFTSLTERVEPSVMVRILNEYLDGMCRIVLESGGTIDKIVGDAVVAFFGAPVHQPDHPQRAVECAMMLDAFAGNFIKSGIARENGVGITRIGVNSGQALIGNFGGSAFFDYTGHGDMVNTAARLESLNKHLGTRICISDTTTRQCQGIRFRPVGAVVVKGKSEGLAVSEPAPEHAVTDEHFGAYMRAYALLEGDPESARAAFAGIVEDTPGDGLAAFHLDRLNRGEKGTTIVMTEK